MVMDNLIANIKTVWNVNKRALTVCFLISVSIAALWIWGFNTHYFTRRDAYDYAQISLQFFQGKGLSTLQIFPRHIPYFQANGILNSGTWPNLYRNPLLMILNTAFLRFFDSVIVASVIQSGFWYIASIPVLFFLAKRLTNLRVAIVSTIFYAADPVIFLYGYSGMTETLATFLLLCLLFVLTWEYEKHWKWFLTGALIGLTYLARTQFIILIPLVLIYAWITTSKPRRYSAPILVLAGLLIVLTPWMVRNYRIIGDPLFSFTTSRNLVLAAIDEPSDLEMQLHAPVDLFTILGQTGGTIILKLFRNVAANIFSITYWANSFRGMYIIFPLFFFVGLIRRDEAASDPYKNFKWFSAILIICTFLVISLTVYSVRSYMMFRPMILIISVNEIVRLLDHYLRSQAFRIAGVVTLILLGLLQLGSEVLAHNSSPPVQSDFDLRTYKILMDKTDEEMLIASDISERISALIERRTLRLPSNPAELLEINQTYLPVDYLLLSKDLVRGDLSNRDESGYHETYDDYVTFVTTQDFLQIYAFDERLPNGAELFVRKDLERK
ncbi:MAG: glycosyltransferase family 39 protein [Anaerolineales bacterium]|nr:glycosyltransferase family 39 protein [Anaerolineales bacterium]